MTEQLGWRLVLHVAPSVGGGRPPCLPRMHGIHRPFLDCCHPLRCLLHSPSGGQERP